MWVEAGAAPKFEPAAVAAHPGSDRASTTEGCEVVGGWKGGGSGSDLHDGAAQLEGEEEEEEPEEEEGAQPAQGRGEGQARLHYDEEQEKVLEGGGGGRG